MKHRSFILVALAALPFTVAAAQVTPPPTPPVPPDPVVALPPTSPVAPLPAVTPRPAPLARIPGEIDFIQLDEIRRNADEIRRAAEEASREARRSIEHLNIDEVRRSAEMAKELAQVHRIDGARIADQARIAALDAVRHAPPISGNFYTPTPQLFEPGFSFSFPNQGQFKWIQGDPADSLYQLARQTMSRYDYSRAAGMFAEVLSKYPNSRRAVEAAYYEAFSRYRVGTLENLRQGLKVLETNATRFQYDTRGVTSDAPALQARILRALAERNESGVDAKLKDLYAKYPSTSCDQEQIQIKSQVLNSLFHSDPDGATPYIRTYLAMRDKCSAELRRMSISLSAQRPSDERTALIIQVAKEDTVRDVRTRAIDVLAGMPGDAAIAALQSLMNDPDDYIQSAAVRSLMRSNSPRARAAMRTSVIDKRDAPVRQRISAIRSFDQHNTTAEDAAYLRSVYNRKDEPEDIKEAVIYALAQMPSEENVNFLLNIAKNPNEPSPLRARALSSISRTTLSIEDLSKLYDASDSRSMRQSLVQALGNRREEAAVNKLLEIVRFSTDPEVRSSAMRTLMNKNDPAITKRVLDLIK